MTYVHDFGETRQARANRAAKARQLEQYCWNQGITATVLQAMPAPGRRALARSAGVNPPKDDSPTWVLAWCRLAARQEWADQHPDDPRAHRPKEPT